MENFLLNVNIYIETLPNGLKHLAAYNKEGTFQNSKKFIVPIIIFFYWVIIEIVQKIADI